MRFFHGARVFLVPMLFCYGALAMPFWAMLLMAVYTGFLTDLAYLNVTDGHVEIALGWSIVVFVFFGLFAHGLQPAFRWRSLVVACLAQRHMHLRLSGSPIRHDLLQAAGHLFQ